MTSPSHPVIAESLPSDQPSSEQPQGKHLCDSSSVRLCQGCELPIDKMDIPHGKSAYCPRCGTQLYRGGTPSLSGNLAIAVTCLLLFIPSHFFDFISIRLIGVMIPATLPSGVFTLMGEGFPLLGLLIYSAALSRRSLFVLLCLSHTHHCVLTFSHHFVIR